MRNALSIGEGRWSVFLQRPGSLALLVVIVAVLFLPLLVKAASGRRRLGAGAPSGAGALLRALELAPGPARRSAQPARWRDGDRGQRGDPLVLVVEAGDVVELPAAGGQEGRARLLVDLLERLQAVGGEARAEHVDPAARPAWPARPASARCRACSHSALPKRLWNVTTTLSSRSFEPLGEQAPGLLALAVVGVAERQRALRHAVEAQHQPIGRGRASSSASRRGAPGRRCSRGRRGSA